MKKIILSLTIAALMSATVSCKKEDDPIVETSNFEELSGTLSTRTLDPAKKYLLKGTVFVDDGSTLTVPAGTVVMGDRATKGTLVIKPGGKLYSNGTASNPVVFTSKFGVGERDRGDWGGIILLGKANVNQNGPSIEGISPAVSYGTYNSTAFNNDNSGSITYTRIEYAGIALSPNNETNSLTLGAVGSETVINHVQASFGGDDSFEWFGGVVNCDHLVAFAGWDDDIDMDFGFQGSIQFALVIRDPNGADQSGSNFFEVDNDAAGSTNTPQTAPVVSNVTIYGPRPDSAISAISGNFQNAAHLRRNSAASIFNSVLTGNNVGILIDGNATYANYTGGTGVLDKNILAMANKGTSAPAYYAVGSGNTHTTTDVQTYWITTKSNTTTKIFTNPSKVADWSGIGFSESLFFAENTTYPVNPNFTVASGSASSGAAFTDAKLSGNAFFTTTTYRGAFDSANDWTDTWCDFVPQNTAR